MFQNSVNYIDYVKEYWELVYNYYSQEYVPYLVNYYNFDRDNSVVDKDMLVGGSYELIGDKTGWRWKRIFFLPVFFVEPIQSVPYTSDQRGVINEVETSIVIPGTYNIRPYEHDLVWFIDDFSPSKEDNKPMWEVKTIERDTISKVSFYKLTLSVLKYNIDQVNNQVSDNYIFVDYFKKIYKYDYGSVLIGTLKDYVDSNELVNKLIDTNTLINFGG